MLSTILLTGTIEVVGQEDHHIRSVEIRLQQYIGNICRYIIDSPFTTIIFCENSGYDIANERNIVKNLAAMYSKQVELLQFTGDIIQTNQRGRGFGESEIMEYALNHSIFISEDQPFVKITGRYFLTNSYKFVGGNHGINMFIRMTPLMPRCSTACYVVTPEFYRTYLRGSGMEVDDSKGKNYMLEGIFYQKLLQHTGSGFDSFDCLPKFQAITGSGYVLKSHCLIDYLKHILLSLGLYNI